MNLYINASDKRLHSALPKISRLHDAIGIHFNLSKLQSTKEGSDYLNISLNLMRDHFKSSMGDIYVFNESKDILIIYHGRNEKLVNDCIFQIKYLFTEDTSQLSFDNEAIEEYCTTYYPINWRDFVLLCETKCNYTMNKPANRNIKRSVVSLISSVIEDFLSNLDWSVLLKSRPICRFNNTSVSSAIIHELCVDIESIEYILGESFDIGSNQYLNKFLQEFFDWKVLISLLSSITNESKDAYLINLNLSTLLSNEFEALSNNWSESQKKRIIIAIDIADIYSNMTDFLEIRENLAQSGFKLCLDKLDFFSFMQVDRTSLGLDLVRIIRPFSIDLDSIESIESQIQSKIALCGSSRVILDLNTDKPEIFCKKLGANLFIK